jgi:hypothetical protein
MSAEVDDDDDTELSEYCTSPRSQFGLWTWTYDFRTFFSFLGFWAGFLSVGLQGSFSWSRIHSSASSASSARFQLV